MLRAMNERFAAIGMRVPQVYLPRQGVDYGKWAVIACDQYTSEPEYWDSVESIVGGAPSTLRLTLPERYLDEPDVEARVETIVSTMDRYLSDAVVAPADEGFVLVRRTTGDDRVRTGLVAAIDLDAYDYSPTSRALIRATEGTIADRIPPRTRVRRRAALELPHVLVLYDDPDHSVLAEVSRESGQQRPLYDFSLMKSGGRITGRLIAERSAVESILRAFERLADPKLFAQRHESSDVLLFAVGDGNHSLAAAKAVWEELKQNGADRENHPGRYALVELVNIHDPGIHFEAIHRVLFGAGDRFADELSHDAALTVTAVTDFKTLQSMVSDQSEGQRFGVADAKGFRLVAFKNSSANLAAGSLQPMIDDFLARTKGARVDYVHGDETTRRLGQSERNCALFLPALSKSSFFETIVRDGCFPRKTFSMGEADEKRFYLEARKIVPEQE